MKKIRNILPLLSILVLTGCGTTSTNKQSQVSINSNNTANKDSTTDTTDIHVVPVDQIDKEAIVGDLSEGFEAETLFTSGTEAMGYSEYYYCFEATENAYSYRKYNSSDIGYATKDNLSNKGIYQPYNNGGSTYLTQVELSLDNKLHYYYLVDSNSSYVMWDTAGYCNPFTDLYGDDFEQNSEDPYQLDLIMGDSEKEKLYTNFANAFTGVMGYTLTSFSLLTNGVQAYGFKMNFENILSSYGTSISYAKGTFGEGRGDEVVKTVSPIKGEEKADFNSKLSSLKEGNYKAEIILQNRSYKADVYNNSAIIYDLYHTDNTKYGSYGYYQSTKSQVHGITKINDEIYADSNPITGIMSSMLPSFDISSVLFDEVESNSTKTTYKLKEDISSEISMESVFFNLLGGSTLGTLTVEFENDKVTFINNVEGFGEEKYVYSDFGSVSDFTSSIKDNCDSLKWSELFSNQPDEYSQLTSKFISEEFLDEIPTIGGTSSYVTLYSNNKRGLLQTVVSIEDYADGKAKIEAYISKVREQGDFTIEKVQSNTLNYKISKEITKNGVTKTVSADVLLAASYFTTPTIVFTFSCK